MTNRFLHRQKEIFRSKTWVSDWLKRYREKGIEGLKNRTKIERPPDIPGEIVYEIKKRVSIQQTRMDYKTGRRSNCKKEWWNKIPLYPHISTCA